MTLPLKIWKTSSYSSDLTIYVSKKIFPAFFITKHDGLLFRSAGRGILVQTAIKSSSLSILLQPINFHKERAITLFFRGKGKKERLPFPLASKTKKKEGPPDRRLIHTSTTSPLAALALNNSPQSQRQQSLRFKILYKISLWLFNRVLIPPGLIFWSLPIVQNS